MNVTGYFPADPVSFTSADPDERKVEFLSRVGMFILFWFCITVLIFPFHPVSGSSMNPTYVDGQEALCIRPYPGKLSQGDVVIAYPGDGYLIIKRVAACPGDTIRIDQDGSVTVNGEPYTYGAGSCATLGFEGLNEGQDGSWSATMGEGEYYLLGDNHENSADSRYYGVFKRSAITEKVLFVI